MAKYQPVEMRGRLPFAAPKLPAQLRQPTKQTLARQVSDSERTDSPSQHNSACTQNRLAPLVPWHNIDTRVLDVCRYLRGKYGADCEAADLGLILIQPIVCEGNSVGFAPSRLIPLAEHAGLPLAPWAHDQVSLDSL